MLVLSILMLLVNIFRLRSENGSIKSQRITEWKQQLITEWKQQCLMWKQQCLSVLYELLSHFLMWIIVSLSLLYNCVFSLLYYCVTKKLWDLYVCVMCCVNLFSLLYLRSSLISFLSHFSFRVPILLTNTLFFHTYHISRFHKIKHILVPYFSSY